MTRVGTRWGDPKECHHSGHLLEDVGEILRTHDWRRKRHIFAVRKRLCHRLGERDGSGFIDGWRKTLRDRHVGIAIVRLGDVLGSFWIALQTSCRRSGDSVRIVPLSSARLGMML